MKSNVGGAVIIFSGLQSLPLSILQNWQSQLPEQDRLRSERMKNERRLRQFVVGRTLLQRGLAELLDLTLDLTLSERGKPEHESAAVSLSHSGDWVAVALASREASLLEVASDSSGHGSSASLNAIVAGGLAPEDLVSENPIPENPGIIPEYRAVPAQLGIDIEVYKSRNYMRLARHYFAKNEVDKLEVLSKVEQQRYFYQLWVLKESLAKYLGTGLNSDLLASEFVAVPCCDSAVKGMGLRSQYVEFDRCALALTANIAGSFESFRAVAEGNECTLRPSNVSFEQWQPRLRPARV